MQGRIDGFMILGGGSRYCHTKTQRICVHRAQQFCLFMKLGAGRGGGGGGLTPRTKRKTPSPDPPLLKAQLGGGKTLFP